MDKISKQVGAILVDYDFYETSQAVRDFIEKRKDHASIIALVGSPNASDTDSHPFVWDVVIRNAKGHPDHVFKLAALNALQEHSNVYPALAIDLFNHDIYYEAGTLLVLDGEFFHQHKSFNDYKETR